MVFHAFHPSTWDAEADQSSLQSFRTVNTENPVQNKTKTKNNFKKAPKQKFKQTKKI